MIKVTVLIPGFDEFNAEFIDEFHLNQFRKHFTLVSGGNVMINGVHLKPGLKIKEILEPQINSDSHL